MNRIVFLHMKYNENLIFRSYIREKENEKHGLLMFVYLYKMRIGQTGK